MVSFFYENLRIVQHYAASICLQKKLQFDEAPAGFSLHYKPANKNAVSGILIQFAHIN